MRKVGPVTEPTDETPTLCVLCPPNREKVTRPGGFTDWACHDRLTASVNEIITRGAQLSARPSGGQGFGRRAPGYASRPPVNLHNATLRDPRTAPAELGDAHAPLNLLLSWAGWIRRARGQDQVGYQTDDLNVLVNEGAYLVSSMDWITRQAWVPRFAEQTKAVVSQLRSATGEPNPRPVGSCERCGHPLFPPRGGELTIVCGGCERAYEPLDQIRMVHRPRSGCAACGHESAQHSNDEDPRRCNLRWCDCGGFVEIEVTYGEMPT